MLAAAVARLRAAGLDSPDLDARLLLGHATGLDLAALAARPETAVPAERRTAFEALIRRRLEGEPVARLLGRREFWSLDLELGPATLIPRPETETVVEAALEALGPAARERPLRLLDLGTGTGAILLALLTELPLSWGLGADRAPDAVAVARRNGERAGVADRAAFLAGDWGDSIAGRFDLVVSNPPYIATAEIAALAPEVRDHDPPRALDGGPDGLGAYRRVAAVAGALLQPSGVLVLELGRGQEAAVAMLLARNGLAAIGAARRDLLGIPRALVCRR